MTGNSKRYIIALDAGGTMTDTFLIDEQGVFTLGKALTNRANESVSYLASVGNAAARWSLDSAHVHKQAISSTYTGTTMVNIILTQSGSKVGLLITRGFKDMPLLERGLTWLGLSYEEVLHQQLHEHTPWMVQPEHVKEISERISVGSYYMAHHYKPGQVIIPLVEEDVVKGVNELLDQGIEVIGILTLASHTNPVHENRIAEIAREIVKKRGVDVPVITSNQVCPLSKENERLKTLLLHCYAAETARKQLLLVEQAARKDGYRHNLLTLLSYGAVSTVHYPKLVEAMVSGPVGGVLGGKAVADLVGWKNVISTDLGGTSFDAGLIISGEIPINKEPCFSGHRLRIPMVSIDSIAAGGGTVIHVDKLTKRIALGPDSVGSSIGSCYRSSEITITDMNLILGYLNPDYFLGGSVKLDKEKAVEMATEKLAKPLGQDLFKLASRILDLFHSQLCNHINSILLSRGLSPDRFVLVASGGGGPLHAWGIGRGIALGGIFMVPWAAAFSAFGVASADYFHRYDRAVTFFYTPDMTDEIKMYQGMALNQAWQELEERAYEELAAEGIKREAVRFRYGIFGSYVGQITTWACRVDKGRVGTVNDLAKIIAAFEKTYQTIYPVAARHPEAGYQITEVYLEAVVERAKPRIPTHSLTDQKPVETAFKGRRKGYIDGKWLDFRLWEMDFLEAGNKIDGPAIIEHPMTTVVIPPQNYVELDKYRFMWFRRK